MHEYIHAMSCIWEHACRQNPHTHTHSHTHSHTHTHTHSHTHTHTHRRRSPRPRPRQVSTPLNFSQFLFYGLGKLTLREFLAASKPAPAQSPPSVDFSVEQFTELMEQIETGFCFFSRWHRHGQSTELREQNEAGVFVSVSVSAPASVSVFPSLSFCVRVCKCVCVCVTPRRMRMRM